MENRKQDLVHLLAHENDTDHSLFCRGFK